MVGRIASNNVMDPQTKEVLIPINREITKEDLAKAISGGVTSCDILFIDNLM